MIWGANFNLARMLLDFFWSFQRLKSRHFSSNFLLLHLEIWAKLKIVLPRRHRTARCYLTDFFCFSFKWRRTFEWQYHSFSWSNLRYWFLGLIPYLIDHLRAVLLCHMRLSARPFRCIDHSHPYPNPNYCLSYVYLCLRGLFGAVVFGLAPHRVW